MTGRKRLIAAAAVGLLIGMGAAYTVWSVLRTPGDPRYVRLDYDGLAGHYATEFLPIQYRPYKGFAPEFFAGTPPERRFGFEFARKVRDRWRLAAVGDIMSHDSLQISAFVHRQDPGDTAGGYDWLLAAAKPVIGAADLAIGNLETVVSADFPRRGFPNFNADPLYLKALASLGFDAMTTANNHILDHGAKGLHDTERNLAAHKIKFTGTRGAPRPGLRIAVASPTAAEPLTIGIISYTDYVNGGILDHIRERDALAEVNYLCIDRHAVFRAFVDWLSPDTCLTREADFLKQAATSIAALRKNGVDYVAVFLHRLRAYRFFPDEQERRQAAELAKRGADAVINTGSHSIMPVERLYTRDGALQAAPDATAREHLIVYGLGNFVSTQGGASAYGLVARIDIGRDRNGRFAHAVTPQFAKSGLTVEEFESGGRSHKLEIYRLRMLDLDAFLAEVRRIPKL
jgi:poly-gamma-glutamate synthesis protein (capsule biosynthesis protein)